MFRRIAPGTTLRWLRAGQVEVAKTARSWSRPPKPRFILEDPSLPLHRLASHAIISIGMGAVFVSVGLTPATAKTSQATLVVTTPFEAAETATGIYLDALVDDAERDTVAAATFFREALRADPHNKELI